MLICLVPLYYFHLVMFTRYPDTPAVISGSRGGSREVLNSEQSSQSVNYRDASLPPKQLFCSISLQLNSKDAPIRHLNRTYFIWVNLICVRLRG